MKEYFYCPEESLYYSYCLETFVLGTAIDPPTIIEFGSGDGLPVIRALKNSNFKGVVTGYELNGTAFEKAKLNIGKYGCEKHYQVINRSFFKVDCFSATDFLVANPPYLPAPDDDIIQPLLRGGNDGSQLTRELLALNFKSAVLMISSYSNPLSLLHYATEIGYCVADFMVFPMRFGFYSSEDKVKKQIQELERKKMAFYSGNIYLLAGVLFQKKEIATENLIEELISVFTSMQKVKQLQV